MGSVSLNKVNWTAGELAPTLYGRDDIQQYEFGAAKMRNVMVVPHGGFRRSPGLRFDAEFQRAQFDIFTAGSDASGLTYDVTTNGIFASSHFSADEEVFCLRERVGFGTEYLGRSILNPSSTGADGFTLTGDTLTFHGALKTGDKIYIVSNKETVTSESDYDVSYTEDVEEDDNGKIALFPFSFSVDQNYLLVFTNFLFSVYKKEGNVFTLQRRLASPYFGSDILELTQAQSLDASVIFHKTHVPLQFRRSGSDSDWVRTWWPRYHAPKFEFNDIYSPGGAHSTAPSRSPKTRWSESNSSILVVTGSTLSS